jgi:uncharacterized iron-regulated membrane protein
VGSILGFPGKVLAFLVTLIGASLPVTGFLVWYGRKFKKKKTKGSKEVKQSAGIKPNTVKRNQPSKEEELVLATSNPISNNKIKL